ncbi:MAG TPA: M67 family peptidase [Gammaproteobacteria bacterium]|nr:M67 family peptidase [Gammaproteobacteria bacterium]
MKTVALPIRLVNQILAYAQNQSDEEICGLIAARDGRVSTIYPVPNVSAKPERLFSMDAKAQIDAMRSMRENGEQLFAIYHSHPHGSAYPSATDLKEAQYPDVVYLIISLDTEGVLNLCGYYLNAGKVETLKVVAC